MTLTPKSCATCKWWLESGPQQNVGPCFVRLPFWAWHVTGGAAPLMVGTDRGQDCDAWAEKEPVCTNTDYTIWGDR